MTTMAVRTDKSAAGERPKEFLNLKLRDYVWPLAFMLSATMVGLKFPPGYLLLLIVMVNRFVKDKYDFIIQLTYFIGGYQLLHQTDLYVPLDKIVFVVSTIMIALYRQNAVMKKTCGIIVAYAICLLIFAMLSEESLKIQYTGILTWLSFVVFIFPLAVFSGKEFDIKVFFRKLFPYLFIFCAYYIIDGIILGGHIMLPRDAAAFFYGNKPTFLDFSMSPFSFIRVWPQGLYSVILCIYPAVKLFRLTKFEWVLIIIALFVSRTFMFMIGILLTALLLQGNFKKILKYAGIGIVTVTILYFVDTKETFVNDDGEAQTALRIRSSIDQFIALGEMEDEEDLAKFGTTRMAQIIPKWLLLYDLNRQWIGFGFLSRENTKMSKYIIINELYNNPEDAEEVATGVEVVPIQVILTIGYIGLVVHILFLIGLWLIVRRLRYATYFLSVMFTFCVIGLSGLSGMTYFHGLYMSALAYGAVILANRKQLGGFSLPQVNRSL